MKKIPQEKTLSVKFSTKNVIWKFHEKLAVKKLQAAKVFEILPKEVTPKTPFDEM